MRRMGINYEKVMGSNKQINVCKLTVWAKTIKPYDDIMPKQERNLNGKSQCKQTTPYIK